MTIRRQAGYGRSIRQRVQSTLCYGAYQTLSTKEWICP
jgi:hypothetical protein